MVDYSPSASDVGGARRVEEMKWLRRLYLPHICFLIHSVHHATEDSVKVRHVHMHAHTRLHTPHTHAHARLHTPHTHAHARLHTCTHTRTH